MLGICDWNLSFQTKRFEYALCNLVLDLTSFFLVFAEELRTNSLDKIFISKRLVEGGELNPPILPILPVSLQNLLMVFCLDIFQQFPLNDCHSIVDGLVSLTRSRRAIKNCILCKRHWIVHLFLR